MHEILVLQQRNLEFEDLRGLTTGGRREFGDLLGRGPSGLTQGQSFVLRLAGRACAVLAGTDAAEGPARKTDRGGSAAKAQPCDVRAHGHAPASGKSVATRSINAAIAASASSPWALNSMVASRGARSAITLATLLALIQSAVSEARTDTWDWNRLASLVSFTAGRACMPAAWISLTLPVTKGPSADVSSIFMSNPVLPAGLFSRQSVPRRRPSPAPASCRRPPRLPPSRR